MIRAGAGTVPAPAAPGSEPPLIGVATFGAGVRVRDRITVEVHGQRYPVSPVSAGFVALPGEGPVAHLRLAEEALRLGRPVLLAGRSGSAAARLASTTGSHWSWTTEPREAHFLTPRSFVAARAAAIRRRQGTAHQVGLPAQRIAVLGVGPRLYGTAGVIREHLARVDAVVGTDWTFDNTLPAAGLRVPPGLTRHVVPYDITDYDRTIRGVDARLTELQRAGVREVALLVEGNPDTLDVLDGIRLTGRTLELVPGIPVGVAAAWEFTAGLRPHPFGSGLAYLSGLPHRHGQSQAELLRELSCYLTGGLACVLVEMTFSDLGAAAEAVRRAPRAKTVVVLGDYSSPRARIQVAHAPSGDELRAVVARGRGVLSTVVVLDDPGGDLARVLR